MTPQAPHAVSPAETAPNALRQRLSTLLDGDSSESADPCAKQLCAWWGDDAQARRDWHTWNLIGDVMRSEELARAPVRDADFLARLHKRLADEPVVLAPAAVKLAAVRGWGQVWLLPAAVVAGFVTVAGVLVVARTAPPSSSPVLAANMEPGPSTAAVSSALPASSPGVAGLIRNPRLESYLRAHQTARGSPAAAVPGGGMRNVEATLNPGTER